MTFPYHFFILCIYYTIRFLFCQEFFQKKRFFLKATHLTWQFTAFPLDNYNYSKYFFICKVQKMGKNLIIFVQNYR